MNVSIQISFRDHAFNFFRYIGIYPEVALANHMVMLFEENCIDEFKSHYLNLEL